VLLRSSSSLLLLRSSTAAAAQQHRPLARTNIATNKQTNKHPGTTIRLTLCERDAIPLYTATATTTTIQPVYGPLSGTMRVSQYQKKHTYPDHQSSFISFLHLLQSISSSLFNLRACQSFCTISVQVLPGTLQASTSYSIHFFTHSLSSFRNTFLYHCNLVSVVPRLCHLFQVFL